MSKAHCMKCKMSFRVEESALENAEKSSCPDCGVNFWHGIESNYAAVGVTLEMVDKMGHFVYVDEQGRNCDPPEVRRNPMSVAVKSILAAANDLAAARNTLDNEKLQSVLKDAEMKLVDALEVASAIESELKGDHNVAV